VTGGEPGATRPDPPGDAAVADPGVRAAGARPDPAALDLAAGPLPAVIETHRARLAAFLRDELVPAEARHGVHEEGEAPAELCGWVRARSAALGLFRLLQPAALGGGGLGPLAETALREDIAASGVALGRFVFGDDGGLLQLGTPSQQERHLQPVLRGELSAAFAFTDAREGPRTTATRRGDLFVVSGVKAFVTDGPRADLLVVVARVVDEAGASAGTALFVVPRGARGLTLGRTLRTLDGGVHGEFRLGEVQVPAGDLLGPIGEGLPRALESITALRLRAAAIACGTARWALEQALAQVDRPHRTGVPLAEREQVRAMLADSAMDLFAARSAVYAAARGAEAGAEIAVEAAMAKALATEAVARVVDRAIQLTGAAAVVEDHPLARCYRRIRGWRIGEGTTEMLKLGIARGLLDRRCAAAGGEGGAPPPA
jgi:acyl-CoA dehydrogenase